MANATKGKRICRTLAAPVRPGMTLVELLAALAIASAILVAALTVTATLIRAEAIGKQAEDRWSIMESVRTVLAMDLAHAERFRKDKTGFSLQTHAVLDGFQEVSHLPAEVTYRAVDVGDRKWLVRSQQIPGGKWQGGLVAADVDRIELLITASSPNISGDNWRPLPTDRPLVVAISRSGSGQQTLRFVGR